MAIIMKLALLTCIFICILKNTLSFDPNAVSHTGKNALKQALEEETRNFLFIFTLILMNVQNVSS